MYKYVPIRLYSLQLAFYFNMELHIISEPLRLFPYKIRNV
jgi:hypothetical protein